MGIETLYDAKQVQLNKASRANRTLGHFLDKIQTSTA